MKRKQDHQNRSNIANLLNYKNNYHFFLLIDYANLAKMKNKLIWKRKII